MYSVAPHLQQEGWALGEAAPPENLLSLREPVSGGRGPSVPGTGVSARVGLEILRGTMEHSQISQRAANRREAADSRATPCSPPARPAAELSSRHQLLGTQWATGRGLSGPAQESPVVEHP